MKNIYWNPKKKPLCSTWYMVQELQCHTTVFSYDHKDDYNLHTRETDRAKKTRRMPGFPSSFLSFFGFPMAFHHLVSTICLTGPSEIRGWIWALLCNWLTRQPQNRLANIFRWSLIRNDLPSPSINHFCFLALWGRKKLKEPGYLGFF